MPTDFSTAPRDAISAVTHLNPYPYYADLMKNRPFYYDTQLGFWIASSADVVASILTSSRCYVRPAKEPVPGNLLGSPAANIYRYLIRMRDGERHQQLKNAALASLKQIEIDQVTQLSRRWARLFIKSTVPQTDRRDLQNYIFQLPIYVFASLMGIADEMVSSIAEWIRDFVRCLAPNSCVEQVRKGKQAAEELLEYFHSLMLFQNVHPLDSILSSFSHQAQNVGCEDVSEIVSNGIGFLVQTYEATAGLLGNTLLALSSQSISHEQAVTDSNLLRQIMHEVLRYDPPIQNTRRFVAQDGVIAEQLLREGETILVVLAAANRDPAVNPNPDRFDIYRAHRHMFTFGMGPHTCPGQRLAETIAQAGIEQLLLSGLDLKSLTGPVIYRPSANARIPLWTT